MNIALVVGGMVAVFGMYMLKHAVTCYKTAVASPSWPTIDGQITDIRLWGKRNIDGEMKDAEKLIIEYNYEIEGLNYTGRSATFYTLVYPKTVEFYDRYFSTRDVKVYYNPKNLFESVLVPGRNPDKPYSDLVLGSVAIAIGIVLVALAWLGIIG